MAGEDLGGCDDGRRAHCASLREDAPRRAGGQLRGNNLTWFQMRDELFLKWQRTCIRVFFIVILIYNCMRF